MKFRRKYEMTTSVRVCLSYDPLKWDFIAFKMIIISIGNALLTRTMSMTLRLRAKVLLHVWSYDFHDMTLYHIKEMKTVSLSSA